MRKVVLILLSVLVTSACVHAQTICRFAADFTGNPVSYTFTSTDMAYANSSGGTMATSGSNLCSGALRRTQLSTIILKLVSSGASAISIPGQSSGSSLRTLTALETSSTIGGTYTAVAGYATNSTINSSSTCGVLDVTSLNIPAGTFVRFTFSGNVSVSGFDITPIAATAPTTQATNIAFSNVAQTGMTIGWTRGNGANVAVFVKDGAGAITNPADASSYTANAVFGSGTQLGSSGYYCVYSGTGTSVDVSGLLASHTYFVQAFEFNGLSTNTKYLTTTATNNPNSQATLAPGSDFRSAASGNWNAAATWETYNGSAWVPAVASPSSSDGVITVRAGHVVTVTASVSVDELTVNSGGEIDVNSGNTFTVANGTGTDISLSGTVKNYGTFTLGASATMSAAATGIYEDAQASTTGTVTLPTATWATGSTCKVTGIVGTNGGTPADFTALQGVNQTFSNFTIDVPNLIGKLVVTRNAAGLFVVSNTFTVGSTGTSTYGVQLTSSGNQEAVSVGSYVQTGGIVSILHNSNNATAKSLTVTGNFTLSGTAVFNISAYTTGAGVTTLSVGGNVSVAPTALLQRNTTFGTGGVTNMVVNGASAQAVNLGTPAGVINYTVNNAAGITLGADLTANGTLTFTAGNISTGSNKVIISSTGSMVNAGTGGWVAGNLQKNVATGAAVARTFEIGDGTAYRPATVTFANVTTGGDLTASVLQAAGNHPNIATSGLDASKTVKRYWTITNTGVVFDQYDVVFNFLAAPNDYDAGVNSAAFLVKKYSTGSWSSPTTGTKTTTSTQATGVTSFSDFAIGEAGVAGSAPTVSTQPTSGSVCTGSSKTFTSASLSSPAPTVQWERSPTGAVWTAVDGVMDGGIYSGFTTGTLTITGATATVNGYQYRAVFTNVNGSGTSNAATLTVDPASVGGTSAGTQTICSGTSPSNLTLSGNTGSVVKWQKASDLAFTTPVDIASSASTTLTGATIGNLSATTYFRAVVQSGACASANSSVVTVTVDPASVGGTSAAAQTICSGTSPANLTLSGNTGSVVKWQKASDLAFTTPVDIASSASTTLSSATIGNLSATTYFRAVVQSGTCATANSSVVTVTVDPVSVGGTSAAAQTICSGTSPANLTLSGNTGSVVKWQKASDLAFTTPVDIASSASTTLTGATIGNLSATTYFRAVVQSGTCASANSSVVTVTVDPVSVGGTTAGAQTICTGSAPATDLTLSGHTGSIVKWQKASDAAFTTPTDIASTSATLTGATIGNLSATTYFRAVVKSGTCSQANSASVIVTVSAASNAGTLNGDQTICVGNSPANIVASSTVGTVQRWESSSSAAFSVASTISNTTTTLSPGVLTATTYYRIVVKSGACNEIASTTPVQVTVNSAITNSMVLAGVAGGASVCNSHSVSASANYFNNCDIISTVTPAGASPVSGTVNTCVKVESLTNLNYVPRTYIITATASSTANVTLYFLQSEFNTYNTATTIGDLPVNGSDAVGKANLRVSIIPIASHTPGGLGEGVYDPADGNIVFNSAANRWEVTLPVTFLANNSFFVHASHWALPVTLVDFKGEQTGASNKLTWITATENNSRGFDVEKSADGKNFSSIAFVASKAENGNSTVSLNYQLTDNKPFAGDTYYRLKQMDKDGKYAYSKVVLINRKAAELVLSSIYPNPAVKELNVVINAPKAGKITLVVTDLSGKVVMQYATSIVVGVNQQTISIAQLASGTYLVKAVCADGCEAAIQRFVKQ